jgi:hydroxymethylpyrimidine pyrophosphatase-like HAD family hydrolase
MSNISKNEQKKILIFDINPGNDEITSELIFGKILHAIKKAVVNQYVVFLSHSNLSILKKICLDMDIKNVFIISDAGARIYNNGTNKIIYEKSIPKQMALSTIHTGIIENNLILVSTTNREMSYGYNFSNKVSLSKKHYVKLPYSSDFPKFIEFVNTNDIFSILIFNNNDEYLSDSYEKFIKVSNE